MLSKRLQILITLMFVTMMFVQTPAMAGSNAVLANNGLSTNSSDYQSGNQFSSGKTTSTTSPTSKTNLNGNTQVSSVNDNYVAYNKSGTIVEMNSSYVNPGQYLNVSINTPLINNFRYNNSLTYSIKSPIGQEPYNSTTYQMDNNTVGTPDLSTTWNGQPLQGSLSYNSSSYSQFYGINISNVVSSPYTVTNTNTFAEKITWNTAGYTTSEVRYGKSPTLSTYTTKLLDGLRTSHTLYLTNLENDTTYYYQVLGKDYFGRTINNTINSFTTLSPTTSFPLITGSLDIVVGSTNATVQFSTQIGISNTDVFISRATTRAQVDNPSNQFPGTSLTSLMPGTQYFFKIFLTKKGDSNLNSTYDNGGLYFSFVTQQSAINLSPVQSNYNSTSSQVTLTFSTDIAANASIIYSTDQNFSSFQSTPMDNQTTSHEITFSVASATKYYYLVNLSTSSNYLIISTNSGSSTSQTLLSSLSTSYPDYLTFQTPINADQDLHITHINLVFQLPTYPAVLGNWSLSLSVNQTDVLSPFSSTLNTVFNAIFPQMFTLNDTLIFSSVKTFIQRGTYTNATSSFPIWKTDANNGVYSPTDNLLVIGKLSYGTAPTQYINSSDWGTYVTTGSVNLYYNGNNILSSKTAITNINNVYDSITGNNPNGVKINGSLLSGLGLNADVDNFVNISIPAMDIYGNVSVAFSVNMPHGTSAPTYAQVQNDALTLNVKYRLLVTDATGVKSYFITQSDLVGTATVIPLQYVNIQQAYPDSNVSNFLNIPGSAIHLNLSVTLDNVQQNIFDFTRSNYTWTWQRQTIDSSLNTGDYIVRLLWTGLDGSSRSIVAANNTAYSTTPTEFSFTFNLDVSFTISDLTTNITVLPTKSATLRFKVVVPTTGVAWDQDLNITTTDGKPCIYNPVTGEYSLTITAGDLTGTSPQIQTVTVKSTSVSFESNTLTYMISSAQSTVTHPGGQPVITNSLTNKHVSTIGLGFIALAVLGTIVYAGTIFYFIRRK